MILVENRYPIFGIMHQRWAGDFLATHPTLL
jgi:hypothetical protein